MALGVRASRCFQWEGAGRERRDENHDFGEKARRKFCVLARDRNYQIVVLINISYYIKYGS